MFVLNYTIIRIDKVWVAAVTDRFASYIISLIDSVDRFDCGKVRRVKMNFLDF
jgi:hypothetical protein